MPNTEEDTPMTAEELWWDVVSPKEREERLAQLGRNAVNDNLTVEEAIARLSAIYELILDGSGGFCGSPKKITCSLVTDAFGDQGTWAIHGDVILSGEDSLRLTVYDQGPLAQELPVKTFEDADSRAILSALEHMPGKAVELLLGSYEALAETSEGYAGSGDHLWDGQIEVLPDDPEFCIVHRKKGWIERIYPLTPITGASFEKADEFRKMAFAHIGGDVGSGEKHTTEVMSWILANAENNKDW